MKHPVRFYLNAHTIILVLASTILSMAQTLQGQSIFEVSSLLKLNPEQKATIQSGPIAVRGILTSVGMNYCTLQDPQSFATLTCGYDPKNRGEFYNSRPGQMTTLTGVPYTTATGALTLSDSRIYTAPVTPPPIQESFNPTPPSSASPISVQEIPISSTPPSNNDANLASIDPIALERAAARVAQQENQQYTPAAVRSSPAKTPPIQAPPPVDTIRPTPVVPPPAGYASPSASSVPIVSPLPGSSSTKDSKSLATASNSTGPDFVHRVHPRAEAQGQSVAVTFGGSLFQTAQGTASAPGLSTLPGYNTVDTKNKAGFLISARYSRTFEVGNDPQSSFVIPAAEGEFFYTGHRHKSVLSNSEGTSADVHTDMDIYAFMVNGLAKFKMNPFYPYVGGGLGLGYITTESGKVIDNSGNQLNLNDYDEPAFAVQGLAGLEYILMDRWSLFGEYKYLHLNDFDMKWGVVESSFSDMDLHMFHFGVRHYF